MRVKKNRGKVISARSITIGCVAVAMLVCSLLIWLFIKYDGVSVFTDTITANEVVSKAKSAVMKYSYSLSTIDLQETIADEGSNTYKYILSSSKNSKKRTYIYADDSGSELYQCWDYDTGKELYSIYIYDSEMDVWVNTTYRSEPVTGTPWVVFNNLSEYTLLDETANWYDSEDECYVLETISSNDKYAVLYEQVFIRVSDFIPMGIVTYGVSDVNEDKLMNGGELEINNENVIGATVEIPTYNEYIQLYEVTFSNDDLSLFEFPVEYMTEDAYLEMINEEDKHED